MARMKRSKTALDAVLTGVDSEKTHSNRGRRHNLHAGGVTEGVAGAKNAYHTPKYWRKSHARRILGYGATRAMALLAHAQRNRCWQHVDWAVVEAGPRA